MKSNFLKKIIAVTVISTSIGTFMPTSVLAIDFYTWQQINSQSNGYWRQSGGSWYFYDSSGILQTGWIYDKGQWYYADASGVMQTGVIQVNGKIYLFSNSGAMQTGNAVVNGKYYTFDQNGIANGSDVPPPTKAYGISGEATVAYTPNQIVKAEDSTPSNPNTVARDPQNLIKYNVKFKDDDGDELRTSSIEKDDKINLYTPTKNGYKFVEWNTKKDGEGKSYDAGEALIVKNDITLYARWEEVQDSGNNNSEEKVLVNQIQLTSSSSSITTKAGTLQMTAKVLPVDASNNAVTWSVQNGTGTATISDSGLLTASTNGTVVVVATAKDGSNISGKANITISGQTDSGTTTPGGTITAFEQNVKLDDVVISNSENIVDLPLLKASGKLPTKAKVTCSLSNSSPQEIEVPIKDWAGTFNGTIAGSYTLTATLGDLPTGYTSTATLPSPKVNVRVQTAQSDNRKTITGAATISAIPLNSDKHIINIALLNTAGILPNTVTLTDDKGETVSANIKEWKCIDSNPFNGDIGIKNLEGVIDVPAGYILPSNVKASTTLNITTKQNANIQEIVEVLKDTGFTLNYTQYDKLDLSNLKVKVKYNDGNYGNISYADFSANNITTPGYFDALPLPNITRFTIPVTFNGKTVYSENVTVSVAELPTVTAKVSGSTVYGDTTKNDIVFNYTLGTGTKAISKVNSVSLTGASTVWDRDNEYTINETLKTITVTQGALDTYLKNLSKTPSTYVLNVDFLSADGKTVIKAATKPTISFISKPTKPSVITLEGTVDNITAKDNTINVSSGLIANTEYEYCVTDVNTTESGLNWTSAKSFTPTKTSMDLTDTNFKVGSKLWIRIKSITDSLGGVNPASDPVGLTITAVGKTKNSAKSITKFTVKAEDNKSYEGIITEGISEGTIKVVLPIGGTDTTPSKISATLTPIIESSTGATIDKSGQIDFTSPVIYTVTAEDGTTRNYTVTVIKTEPQVTVARSDSFSYTVTENVLKDGITTPVTSTKQFNILTDGYEKALIGIDSTADGFIEITPPSSVTTEQGEILNKIRTFTPYSNPQIASVGVKFTPSPTASSGATSVKIADSLEGLKTATAVPLSSSNMAQGKYVEQIPTFMYSAGAWIKLPKPKTLKYYQWIDIKGNIIGYTALTITVV